MVVKSLIETAQSYCVKKINQILRNGFHSSTTLLKRKTGEKDFLEFRKFSKKQMKRKKNLIILKKERIDHSKEILKAKRASKRLESPQMKKYIEETRTMLEQSLSSMILPDGISESTFASLENNENPFTVFEKLKTYASIKNAKNPPPKLISSAPGKHVKRDEIATLETKEKSLGEILKSSPTPEENQLGGQAGMACLDFAKLGNFKKANELMQLMEEAEINVPQGVYAGVMIACSSLSRHDKAREFFNKMIKKGITPGSEAWAAHINEIAQTKGFKSALDELKRLEKLKVPLIIPMFNCILKEMIEKKADVEEIEKFWIKMHGTPNVSLDVDSFNIYLHHLQKTARAERALFLMDEMKALDVTPNEETFVALLKASAFAPHFVKGFEDTIIDALRKIESYETIPTTDIYNALIFAFAMACDARAAEFYFWEMRQKGIKQNPVTFSNMLLALERDQLVGVRMFAKSGRYSRPPDKPLNPDDQALADIGPDRANQLMSQSIETDDFSGRGKERQMRQRLIDAMDDPDQAELMMSQVRAEANKMNEMREKYEEYLAEQEIEEKEKMLEITENTDNKELKPLDEKNKKIENKKNKSSVLQKEIEHFSTFTPLSRVTGAEELNSDDDDEKDSDDDDEEENSEDEEKFLDIHEEDVETLNEFLLNMEDEDLENLLKANPDMEKLLAEIRQQQQNSMSGKSLSSNISNDGEEICEDKNVIVEKRKPKSSTRRKLRGVVKKSKKMASSKSQKNESSDNEDENEEDQGDEEDEGEGIEEVKESLKSQRRNISLDARERPIDSEENFSQSQGPFCDFLPGEFSDPFGKLRVAQRRSAAEGELSKSAQSLVDLVDLNVNDKNNKSSSALERRQKQERSRDLLGDLFGETMEGENDSAWDLVEFGRPPAADYSGSVYLRHSRNIRRADMLVHTMREEKVAMSSEVLSRYLSTYANASRSLRAQQILDSFALLGLRPDRHALRSICKMRLKINGENCLQQAREVSDLMVKWGHGSDAVVHTLLVEASMRRGLLVEALTELEKMHDHNLVLPERVMRMLRNRCRSLGVTHPYITSDPNAWVEDLHKLRRTARVKSQKNTQGFRNIFKN